MERDREIPPKADRPQGDSALHELARSVSQGPAAKRASRFARRVVPAVPPLVAALVPKLRPSQGIKARGPRARTNSPPPLVAIRHVAPSFSEQTQTPDEQLS